MNSRQLAEEELKKDENKSDDQILADVYEEFLKSDRQLPQKVTSRHIYMDLENIKHGLKRLSGFFYNQSKSSAALVRIGILISIITLAFAMANIFPVERIYQNIKNPVMPIFVGVMILMGASFIGIINSAINFRRNKVVLVITTLTFVGLLMIEVGLYSTLLK